MLHRSASAPPWNRAEVITLVGILVIATMVRIGAAIVVPTSLESDYYVYWTIAKSLYAGQGFVVDDKTHPTAFVNLGYPIFLYGVFTIFGPTVAALKAANIALGTGATFLLYLATRGFFRSRLAPAIAAFLFATYLESITYCSYAAKENLLILLIMAQLVLAVTPAEGRWRYANPILFGATTGAIAIVGNAGMALLPAMLLLVWFTAGNIARTGRYLALAAIFGMLVTAPMLWRNHQVFGAYVLNNNGGVNLYVGNNPLSTPYFQYVLDSPVGSQWHTLYAQLGERGIDVMLGKIATQYIEQNPVATLKLAVRKGLVFWIPPFHSGKYQESTLERIVRLGWLVEFFVIVGLFLAGTLRGVRGFSRQFVVLWLFVAGYTAVHMIFYVVYRYRLPIMPILCVGAGFGGQPLYAWALARGFIPARLNTFLTAGFPAGHPTTIRIHQ